MTNRVHSPGTTRAEVEAAKVLHQRINDPDLCIQLADRIVKELQTRQYHGGMRVLLKARQSRAGRSALVEAVIADGLVTGLHVYAVSDAMAVAAHILWDAEGER